jgi:hypothetical protein
LKRTDRFLRYGVSSDLAGKAVSAGLTITSAKSLGRNVITSKFGLTADEAEAIKNAVVRKPIDADVLYHLLERSNFTCNVCKGVKSHGYIIHHIEEYEIRQDNRYVNLVVLCPSDHDLAHRSGLTLGISKDQLRKAKRDWEKQVEVLNVRKAAQAINVRDNAIDYVNIRRIEELCVRLFGEIPDTTLSARLKKMRILGPAGSFDQKYVRDELSGGRYLFDYMNSHETEHYKQLLEKIANVTEFVDLTTASSRGFRAIEQLEGRYAYFIGGVSAKRPRLPITNNSSTVLMHYTTKNIRIEWVLDPMFLISMSAIGRLGSKNRFIIYCLIRTVEPDLNKTRTLVKASPLLIAQPTTYIDKTPAIAYQRAYERDEEEGWIEEDFVAAEDDALPF